VTDELMVPHNIMPSFVARANGQYVCSALSATCRHATDHNRSNQWNARNFHLGSYSSGVLGRKSPNGVQGEKSW